MIGCDWIGPSHQLDQHHTDASIGHQDMLNQVLAQILERSYRDVLVMHTDVRPIVPEHIPCPTGLVQCLFLGCDWTGQQHQLNQHKTNALGKHQVLLNKVMLDIIHEHNA